MKKTIKSQQLRLVRNLIRHLTPVEMGSIAAGAGTSCEPNTCFTHLTSETGCGPKTA